MNEVWARAMPSAQNIVSMLQMVVLTFLAPLSRSILNMPVTNSQCGPQKTTLKGTWPHSIRAGCLYGGTHMSTHSLYKLMLIFFSTFIL